MNIADKRVRLLKFNTIICCLAILSCCNATAARADGGSKAIIGVPVRLLATAVGTPIAMVRRSVSDTKSILAEYKGDNYSWKFWGGLIAPWVGICQGTIEGCFYGPKHAFTAEDAFSKEAFSLSEMD